MTHCEACGTKLAGGICPNCEEELLIATEQADDLEYPLSAEFEQQVAEQAERAKARRSDEV